MHVNLSWLKLEDRLTSSILVFVSIDMLKAVAVCLNYYHTTRTPTHIPQSRADFERHTLLHRAMTTWNSIFHIRSLIQAVESDFFLTDKNTPYGTAGPVKRYTQHMHTTHMDFVL